MGELKILVLLRMVPDVVEELEVGPDGMSLDTEFLRLIANESDEHALEEALILRDRHGGTVSVVAVDGPEIDDALFASLAKGADRVVKVAGASAGLTTLGLASVLAGSLESIDGLLPVDLMLTGCQSIDDLDGQLAPLLAHELGNPYLGLVTAIEIGDGGTAIVLREFSGGVRGRYEVDVPAVLGIQAAEKPPRYVPVAKVRAAKQSGDIEEAAAAGEPATTRSPILGMAVPATTDRAEMLGSDPAEAAARIVEILSGRGLV